VNFLTARTVNLKPSATTHIDAVRQSDGSYTGFEVTDAAPYRLIETTSHLERQFAACIPHTIPASPSTALPTANPLGASSQLQVSAPMGPNYFVAHLSADALTIYFDVFDAQHNLLSEKPFTGSAGEIFQSLSLADLNADTKLDLIAVMDSAAAAPASYGGVWTFLGNGDGTFQTGNRQVLMPQSQAAAQSVSVGDLNGDSKPDLVLAAPDSAQLDVFLGNGDGSFQTQALPLTIPGDCGYPVSAAIADLNGDGKADLVASPCQSGVAIALGNGDGTFQTPAIYPAMFPAYFKGAAAMVAVGDVNADGIPDIVTSAGTILFGDGKGGVASRADYEPNLVSVSYGDFDPNGVGQVFLGASVILGDFDGDGKTDILFGTGNLTYLSGNDSYPALSVLFGAGGGVFTGAPVSGVPLPESGYLYDGLIPPPAQPMVTADFNGDGIPDLATVTFQATISNPTIQVTTMLGRGNGQFSSGGTQTVAHPGGYFLVESAVAADFNHDGKSDLAVLVEDSSLNGEVQIYAGKGDGTFSVPQTFAVPVFEPFSISAPDVNGDGIPDLAITGESSVLILLGKGDGTFVSPGFTVNMGQAAIAFGDFNGDGKLDLAAANSGATSLSVLLGKGDGTFSSPVTSPLPAPALGFAPNIAVADFDGDGRLDVAIALNGRGQAGPQEVAVLLGKGDGTFPISRLSAGPFMAFASADLNGDKIPDLIGLIPADPNGDIGTGGSLSVRLGNGDGTFQPDDVILADSSPVVVADLNRDGSSDVAALYGGGIVSLLNDSQPAAPLTVVSAATYVAGPLAPGAIATAFAAGILPEGQTATGATPLRTTLLGISVTVQDSAGVSRPASLYFVSANQINFLVPAATALGLATIAVNGSLSDKPLTTQVQIAAVAPELFTVGSGIAAAYAVQVGPGGTQTTVPVFTDQSGNIAPAPIDLTQPGAVYLTLFGTGFDATGAGSVLATVQGVSVSVTYAGPQGSFLGLDQMNLLLPSSLAGTGVASINVSVAGQSSNTVFVTIQ